MIKDSIKRHPLISYFIIAYVVTWVFLFPIVGNIYSENWHFLGALGPTVSAFLVVYITKGKEGIRNLKKRLFKYKVGSKWILVALSPIALFILALLIDYIISGSLFNFREFISTNELSRPSLFFLWILPLVFYGIFEEIGWRGFALPRLQKKYTAFKATFILTIFWGFWHFPMFFYRFDFSLFIFFGFFISLFFGAIIFTSLINSTKGSIFVVMVWHFLWNVVAVIDTIRLTTIMSVMITIAAILIIRKFGKENLSAQEKFVER